MGTRNISYSSKTTIKKRKNKKQNKTKQQYNNQWCFSFLFLYNKLPPKLSSLKSIYFLSVCECGLTWFFGSGFSQTAIKVLDKAAVISRFDWERICLQAHSSGCWQDTQFLWAVALRTLSSSLVAGRRLPSVTCNVEPLYSTAHTW